MSYAIGGFPYDFPILFSDPSIISAFISGSTATLKEGSVQIDLVIEQRSTGSFTVVDTTGTASYRKGEPVAIYNADGTKVFGGVIHSSTERIINKDGGLFHDIRVIDWHWLSDKRIAARSYEDKTCGYIVADLITEYLSGEGVTVGEVQAGPPLSTCVIKYVSCSSALDKLAEAAGFTWYIDESKALYFIDRATNAAPWNISGTEGYEIYNTVRLRQGNDLYRNTQYERGIKCLTSEQTATRIGDGETRAFTMDYPLGKVPTSIKVDTVAKTFGIKGVESGKDWYWSKGDPVISQDVGGSVLTAGNELEVKYYGEFEAVVAAQDETAVAAQLAIEGAGTGVVEHVVEEADITDLTTAIDAALAKIARYSPDGKRYTYTTRSHGIFPGQLQTITDSLHGLTAQEFLIESVSIEDYGSELRYNVTAIQGPSMGGWSKLFKELSLIGQSFLKDVDVGTGTLVILKQFSGAYIWTGLMATTEWTCPLCGDATLCGDSTIIC